MAGANIKIGANSSDFQRKMQEVARQLKVTQSEFKLASESAKLFGNSTDQLKAKQNELGNKLKGQNTILKMQEDGIKRITKDIKGYKDANNELSRKIEQANKEQKEAVKIYGKGSKEVKELNEKLKTLKEQYAKNERAIESSNKKIDNQKIKMNEAKIAIEKTKKTIEDNSKALEKMGDKFAKAGEKAGKISDKMKPVSIGIIGVGTASAKMAMDFEDGMAKVSTIADTSKVPINELRKGVLHLSSDTGKSAKEMSEGLYEALSASVDTSEAVNFMGTATKAAVGGFTDTSTAVDGLTTVLNSYGLKATEANNIANQMLVTQNLGKTTFGEMASSIGKVTPITSQLGISTKELFSSLASTTAQGLATAESVTALKASMSNIIKPSKEAADAAEALGIKFNVSELQSKGWMPFLQDMKKGLEQASPELKSIIQAMEKASNKMSALSKAGKSNSKEYKQAKKDYKGFRKEMERMAKMADSPISAMATMFGSVEGLNSILMLTSENGMNIYNESMKQMDTNTTALDDAYDKISNTTQYKFKASLNQAQNAMIDLGDTIAPFISLASLGISKVAKSFNGLSDGTKKTIAVLAGLFVTTNLTLGIFSKFAKNIKGTIKVLKDFPKGIKKTGEAIKGLPGKFKSGITGIKSFGKSLKTAIKNVGKFSKAILKISWKGITKGVSLANKGIKLFARGLLSGIKGVGKFSKSILKIGWKGITKGASLATKGIKGLGKGLLTGVKAVGKFTLSLAKMIVQLTISGAKFAFNTAKMLAQKVAMIATTVATKAMELAQGALNLIMSLNPITLIIGLLVSLGATFVILYNKCEWFRNGVNAVWNGIKSVFSTFANFLSGAFTKDWTQSLGLLGVPLNFIFGVIGSVWGGIKGVFNGVIEFLKGVFTGNWRQAFSGLGDIVKSIFGALGGIIKAPINAAIRGINWCISKINGISFTVPDWVPGIGGSHFGVHLPTIPALADGGIVTKATLALVGEGKEHEAVIPLSKLDKLVTNSVQKVLSNTKTSQNHNQEIYIIKNYLDGEEISNYTYRKVGNKLAIASRRR